MCEIAVIPVGDVESDDEERLRSIVSLAEMFYDDNPHGLGIVVTERDPESETFNHFAFKTGWTEQGMSRTALYEFLDEKIGDAWRVTVHARFATAGDVDKAGTHPIITADQAGPAWDAVVHNGSIRGHKAKRSRLRRNDDHTFATEVDSEVIAHVTDAPDSVEDFLDEDDGWEEPNLRGNLNFLLYSEEYILAYTEGKYHIGDDFSMACDFRDYNTDVETSGEEGWFLITPDGDLHFRERSRRTITSRTTSGSGNRINNPWYRGYSKYGADTVNRAENNSASNGGDDDESSDSSSTTTRETPTSGLAGQEVVLSQNPHISDEEALDYHEGWFVGADSFVCKEHGQSFVRACPTCVQEGVALDTIGLTHIPDIYQGGGVKGPAEVTVEDNSNVVVNRCPSNKEWYVRRDCPFCGVPHQDDDLDAIEGRLKRHYAQD